VEGQTRGEQLDAEILDGVSELIGRIMALGESMAQRLRVPSFFIKALHALERPMAMKDLGKGMHCDPSFVTVVADMLEKRGLARREVHPGDRRVKNLVLTMDGLALKHRVESEMAARMPWSRALDEQEREQLLALIRKMLTPQDPPGAEAEWPESLACPASAHRETPASAGEVDDTVNAAPAPAG
jgi:MarR family transcriptional regulator, organic hydroperoxide resistance regulator